MARIEKTVFISYRRKDITWALLVYQDLTHQGYDVFFDYTSIPSGDFEQIIISNIKARAHFVLILTPTTFDRCGESGDWLRREVETAIDEKRNIIPLFFDGFNFGSANISEKLTGKLSNVSRYSGMNVHQDYFHEAMERLRTRFLKVPLDAVLHPVSTDVQKVVIEEQRAANMAAANAKREEKKKKRREFVSRIFNLITSKLRWLGIGVIVLLVLIFSGFGLNYLFNNSPVAPATVSPTDTATPKPPISTSTLGIGSTMIGEKGETLVYVPKGEFTMGNGDSDAPVHTVYLDAFWIDQTEVTNKQYQACVDAGTCESPSSANSYTHPEYYGNPEFDNYPVIYVNWDKANRYCEVWAGGDLPTEAQWEKAARGTDGRTYPWGKDINCDKANYNSNCVGDISPVRSYVIGKSPYEVYEMAGNIWEWVHDYYQSDYFATLGDNAFNPQGPSSGEARVLRGGSWSNYIISYARSAVRFRYSPTNATNSIGFRCAHLP